MKEGDRFGLFLLCSLREKDEDVVLGISRDVELAFLVIGYQRKGNKLDGFLPVIEILILRFGRFLGWI